MSSCINSFATFGLVLIGLLFTNCESEPISASPPGARGLAPASAPIDSLTGLVIGEHFALIKANCLACHSAKLITQNRATREGWAEMIDWMQATQGLWPLEPHEPAILDYLSTHYAPEEVGRRANLGDIEWYEYQ